MEFVKAFELRKLPQSPLGDSSLSEGAFTVNHTYLHSLYEAYFCVHSYLVIPNFYKISR